MDMPSKEVHIGITSYILSLSNWQYLSDDLKEVLIEHVTDPDEKPKADREEVSIESCTYENRDIDLEECRALIQRRDKLKRSYVECVRTHGIQHDECRKLKAELESIENNLKIERKPPQVTYSKHHGGLNTLAYRYYFVNAVRCYMLCQKEESMKHLARALHYIQDAPLKRKPESESLVEDCVVVGKEDYHEVVEDEVGKLWEIEWDKLINEFKREIKLLDSYVNKKDAEHELTKPSFIPVEILRKALYGTYVVLRKFEQNISRLSKDVEKLRRTYHTLKVARLISFAILLIGVFILVLVSVYPLLGSEVAVQLGICTILSGAIGMALSMALLENKKLTFYMAGLIEKPPEFIMKATVMKKICGEGGKVVERKLQPSLQPCIPGQPVCRIT